VRANKNTRVPKYAPGVFVFQPMKKSVNSVSVENVLAMSMPNMPFEAVWTLVVDGIALIVVSDGMSIAVAGAIFGKMVRGKYFQTREITEIGK
jgi:hypothetical protein